LTESIQILTAKATIVLHLAPLHKCDGIRKFSQGRNEGGKRSTIPQVLNHYKGYKEVQKLSQVLSSTQ